MSVVNPYEPSQLLVLPSRAEALPAEEISEREQRVFGTRSPFIALGARYWLLGLLVHHSFALAGYGLYLVDWEMGGRTFYRHLGFAIMLIGIVISLFVSAAGQLQLCRWPPSLRARWWFRAAFVCFLGMMILGIGDLMLTLKYRENRDPALWQVIELERPSLLAAHLARNLLLTIGLFQVGRLLQDRLLWGCAGLACLGGILLGSCEVKFELLGSLPQVLREITYLEPLEQAAVSGAWLALTGPLVVAMFRLFRIARQVVKVTPAEAVDDPLAD